MRRDLEKRPETKPYKRDLHKRPMEIKKYLHKRHLQIKRDICK